MKTAVKLCASAILIVSIAAALAADSPTTPETGSPGTPTAGLERVDASYQGPWVTTKNKKLDGIANCQIQLVAKDRWLGRFWGVWQQVPFDYTVEFSRVPFPEPIAQRYPAPIADRDPAADADEHARPSSGTRTPSATLETSATDIDRTPAVRSETLVVGKALIDGASYQWTGQLTTESFKIQFSGNRYEGSLDLKRVADRKLTPPTTVSVSEVGAAE